MKTFDMTPKPRNADGEWRKVGLEFEMAGLSAEDAADIVVELFGGSKEQKSLFEYEITGTRFGDFSTELDADLLKSGRYKERLKDLGLDIPNLMDPDEFDRFVMEASQLVVPCEIVTPPIPMNKLEMAEELRLALHDHQAKGTKASPIFAFGLHLNPEVPDTGTATQAAYLRAFVLLEPWLREVLDLDLTRRMAPYIDPFEDDYRDLLAAPEYDPDLATLVRDYVRHNPTRNRSLDMLPLLCHLDCDLLEDDRLEMHLVKPRPAFHYRLPNCLVDDPEWTVAREWDYWLTVERLANDRERLDELGRIWLDRPGLLGSLIAPSWVKRVEEFLS